MIACHQRANERISQCPCPSFAEIKQDKTMVVKLHIPPKIREGSQYRKLWDRKTNRQIPPKIIKIF